MWIAFLVYLVLIAAMFGWLVPWLGSAPPWRSATPAISWYAYLKDWQTGIGALVGILGLVLVEAVDRWLERQRAVQERRNKQQAIAAALAWEVRECEERLGIARNNIDDALGALRGAKPAKMSLTGKLAFSLRLPAPVVLSNLVLDLHLLDGDLRRADPELLQSAPIRGARRQPKHRPKGRGAARRLDQPGSLACRAGAGESGYQSSA